MNRDKWNVDDELSRLGDEIKKDNGQHREAKQNESAHYRTYQHLEGSGNVQVAGNLIFDNQDIVNPKHPDAMNCPQCKKLTYRGSDWCRCGFNIQRYRTDQARKMEKNRLIKVMVFCGIPGLLIVIAGTKFFTGTDLLYPLGVGGGLLYAAYIAAQTIDHV